MKSSNATQKKNKKNVFHRKKQVLFWIPILNSLILGLRSFGVFDHSSTDLALLKKCSAALLLCFSQVYYIFLELSTTQASQNTFISITLIHEELVKL